MSTQVLATSSLGGRLAFTLAASLALTLWVQEASAQELRVTAANSSDDAVYDVLFAGSGGSISTLNTDQKQRDGIRSLVFVPNESTGQIDLIAADTEAGEIVRYAGAKGAAKVIFSSKYGKGPACPEGLSVDAAGNLFVVSSSGHSKSAEVWVLPRDPALPAGAGFKSPLLLDRSFGGISVKRLEETLVASATLGAVSAGDLLVLSSDPAKLFAYSADRIQQVISGGATVSPSRILLTPSQFGSNAAGSGMDFWRADNTLLVTTTAGRILRFSFADETVASLPDFATGLGQGTFKIRSGVEGGIPFAVVTDTKGGKILKFGAPPESIAALSTLGQTSGHHHPPPPPRVNPPISVVSRGVDQPKALAASNLANVAAGTCLQSAGGCDLLGNVIKHEVTGVSSLSGFVIEDTCIVPVDPRITEYGSCTGHNLPVAQVCAGYGDTVIPDTMCGGSGASGKGFALVRSKSNALSARKGAFVLNEVFPETIVPGDANPPCPRSLLGWAPLAGEGTIVEGNQMLELTATCGSSGGGSKGLSLWGIGLVLNEAALPGKNSKYAMVKFAETKFDALEETVKRATIAPKFSKKLCECIGESRHELRYGKYGYAADKLVKCDALVAANEASFTASADDPNPSGDIRARFANIYLTLKTRVLGYPPPHQWPPP
jgi:hypothetical protein